METEEKKNPLKPLSHGRRNVKYFDITGHTLVHPMSYNMQGFQKQIIMTAIFRNTLISLPSGLGMPFLASVIVFNFQRWFLNGKIVVLSQTKNCIVEQINAYNSYTTLSNDLYGDLYGNASIIDNDAEWKKPIVLSPPVKFLDSIQNKMCSVNDLVLLIVYETSKITKCQEYKDIMTLLDGLDFRVNVFIEGCCLNPKALKQIIETFNISQIEFRNLTSIDIKDCTFRSDIESVSLEISPHMVSIKDAFFAVFEKYGKLLKDANVITGNVTSFTKNQVQKAREKLIKAPPQNMNKETLQNLLDGMTMCSFLCVGIEILHNWGVRSFYNYLFDENKDSELKRLIVKDELLKNQMKLLNEYLKSHGKKMESLMSRIVHPKLIYLKNLILRSFSEAEGIINDFRIVIFSSMDEIIDDVDRLVSTLPNFIRHQCVRTKSKSLSSTNDYKEVVQNFNGGVINVLVLNNLVEEINDLKTNMIVSLEPSKPLLKFSDPRFYPGADKCFFILTKGNEYLKFETLLNEKKNEQKSIELPVVDHILQDSPVLFPEDFNPDFETTSVGPLVLKSNQTVNQKSMLNYLKSEPEEKSRKSISVFNDSDYVDASIFVSKNAPRKLSSPKRSRPPSFFEKTDISVVNDTGDVENHDDFYEQLYPSPQPIPYSEQIANSKASRNDDDSCDELILDFAVPPRNKLPSKPAKTEELLTSQCSDKENFDFEVIDTKISKGANDMNHNEFNVDESDTEPYVISKLQKLRDRAANLTLNFNKSESSEEVANAEPSKCSSLFDADDDFFKDFLSPLPKEKLKEDTLFESSRDDTRLSKNSRTSIDMVLGTGQNLSNLQKNVFKESTLFANSTDDAHSIRYSRSSIDMVDETRQNPTTLQKNVFRESTLLGNSTDDAELSKYSRSSIDMVLGTGQNPSNLQKNVFKEKTLFGNSTDDGQLSKYSRSSIDMVLGTGQNPSNLQKNAFGENTLFGSSKDDTLGKNSRSSIDVVNDTRPGTSNTSKNKLKEVTLFGSSKAETPLGKNSRTSIDMVNETKQTQTTMNKFTFKRSTFFASSKNDAQFDNSSRKSIDVVNDTGQNSTQMEKNKFKEVTLFGNSKDESSFGRNPRTSIEMVDETKPNPQILNTDPLKETTLFGSSKNYTLGKNSRTGIDPVHDTRPNPFSAKSPIFSTRKFNSQFTKTNQIRLKDRSPSIHFDSSFELDDDFTIANLCDNKPIEEGTRSPEFSSKSKPIESNRSDDSSEENEEVEDKLLDVANVDDWDPDCELFQDDDEFDNIVTPPKEAPSIKTSTPIAKPKITPKETSPIVKDTEIIDLISPQKKPIEQSNRPQFKKTSPVGSSTSTELPIPTRSLKNFSTDTCDINLSDDCRKTAITNSFFSNFSLALEQKRQQNQNTQKTAATTVKRCKMDDDNDDFPWMKTNAKPPEKAKLKSNSDDDVSVYPWMKKSPVKPAPSSASNSCGSSWLKKSPVQSTLFSATNNSSSSWLKKYPTGAAASSTSSTSSSPNALKPFTSCSTSKPSNSPSIAHSTPDFKIPGPFIIRSSTSKSAQSSSGSDQKSVSDGSTPELKIVKNKTKKKTSLKRNLAKQFLDNEAAVSSDDSDDTTIEEHPNMYENDSFIDDEVTNKKTNYSHYLKSIKSPGTEFGKFRIPVLSESKLRTNVCSQMDYFDHTYQHDSFCVDDVDDVDLLEQDSEYAPSVLTQMENKLKFKQKKSKRSQTASSNEDSFNDEESTKPTVRHKKKHRRRIMCFSSSDSDDAKS